MQTLTRREANSSPVSFPEGMKTEVLYVIYAVLTLRTAGRNSTVPAGAVDQLLLHWRMEFGVSVS